MDLGIFWYGLYSHYAIYIVLISFGDHHVEFEILTSLDYIHPIGRADPNCRKAFIMSLYKVRQ